MPKSLVQFCASLSRSTAFNLFIVIVVLLNAVVLGLATYPRFSGAAGGVLAGLETVFLVVFVAELAIRLIAHGRRPQDFFRSGWNVFDLVVIGVAFVPGLASNATLLRMARLARVLRVVRFFPALRTILVGIARSLPGVAGFLALSALTLYLYGMVGWMLFGDVYPAEYGTVGRAVLTLFLLLSLETLPDAIAMGLAVSPWTLAYFVSYVLVASYLLVNVLVGVVINSMEETRQAEKARPATEDDAGIAQRLEDLRLAVQALEAELSVRQKGS
ncbi:ion transporter [Allorhizocola rhizosphaerae]|uniref:ion transporter n=1 Tax=Allorhizocola rhizosphaerae TaxID=1872709 RepID=UPI000E3BCB4F|nr:ion transporter [Allorhizocola rhizosphaerae]